MATSLGKLFEIRIPAKDMSWKIIGSNPGAGEGFFMAKSMLSLLVLSPYYGIRSLHKNELSSVLIVS